MKITCKYCGIVSKPHKCPHKPKRKTDRNRSDNKVYESKEYRKLRVEVLDDYNYTCLWALYIQGQVVEADRTHHIIEILDDESKAVDYFNLIPLHHTSHEAVHKLYKLNDEIKLKVQDLQRQMIKSFKEGDKTLGKYKNSLKEILKNISPPI